MPRFPSGTELATRAQQNVLSALGSSIGDQGWLRTNADRLIVRLLDEEYAIFKEEERRIFSPYLASLIDVGDGLEEALYRRFNALDRFFLSRAQARKSRAGGSFERHVAFLLRLLELPFEEQQIINGKPDFLLPSADLYRKQPANVILITAKRTLRERWRQIIIEGSKTARYFLATIDEKLSVTMMAEAAQHRVFLVIPQPVIERVTRYQKAGNVISFSQFLEDYVEPARRLWPTAQ